MKKDELKKMIKEEFNTLLNEGKYVLLDKRANVIGTGQKSQVNQAVKKKGGNKKGFFAVPQKNALKAKRALEKLKGNWNSPEYGDKMMDLYWEGKLTEGKYDNKVSEKFKSFLDNLPEKKMTPENVKGYAKSSGGLTAKYGLAYAMDAFGWMKYMKEGKLTEASKPKSMTAKDILAFMIANIRNASRIPRAYRKEYVKSMTNMAKRKPQDFARDYGKFKKSDWIEDITYNLQNEGKLDEMKITNKKTGKDITKHMLAYLMGKISKKKFEKLTGLSKEKLKVTEGKLNEGFATWEMSFAPMILSGVKLDPKKKYKVKARSTVEAIKKASKMAGLSGNDWMATQTHKLIKIGV